MKLGFTGTREDLTFEQFATLWRWLDRQSLSEFHHGCCLGADSEAVDWLIGKQGLKIVAHPPIDRRLFSYMAMDGSHEKRDSLPYLDRNKAIVNETEHLLACPKGEEELRSGTWSTIRFARKLGRPVTIIWPDGRVEKTP